MKTINKINSSLNIVSGNIFDFIEDIVKAKNNGCSIIVPHVCNNVNVFGAGFAAAVANKYPIVKENYHLLGPNFLRNNLGHSQFVEVINDKTHGNSLIFANMISQNGTISSKNPRPLNYAALARSMTLVSKFILTKFDKDQRVQIHCPKFGCGLAGGNWNFIQELIKDIWSQYPVIVYEKK
jgi:hypothetical protein